jgi:hypothetical protein
VVGMLTFLGCSTKNVLMEMKLEMRKQEVFLVFGQSG